ncbi:MAG: hypothetical protein ACYCU3_22665, partial [Streptosporangiaceae bacterium]
RGADGEADHEERTRPAGSATSEAGTAGGRPAGEGETTGRPVADAPLARAWPYTGEPEPVDSRRVTRRPGPAGRGPARPAALPQRDADGWPYQDSGEPRSPSGKWTAGGPWEDPYGSGPGAGGSRRSGRDRPTGSRGAAGRAPGSRRQSPSAGWNLEDSGELEPLPPDGGIKGGPDDRSGRGSAWRPSSEIAVSREEPADTGGYPPSGRGGTGRGRPFRGRGEQRQPAGPADGRAGARRPGGSRGERTEPESGQAEPEYEGESW